MHLQSLELIGFKSFADKTLFEFHEGVTAIVGPNGCGKSNVLDAVRWVLGEQSAKALRGGEMADVIFNGTDSRKPVGYGEVSLTFTDCESELGVEWHDVRVTRRVYRDGNSEYLLNKTTCRLKDIQSLFADTGVGRSAYSIMEQGKIDLILSSRPEDRRAVFEEAAGITKYKTQKREALRKLEATEANLLRIGDIIKEVKRQIGSLQRQAGKARRYQTLLADLQVLDTHHSRSRLEQLDAELAQSTGEISRHETAERAAHAEIEQTEDSLGKQRRELGEIDNQIGDARAEVLRLQSAIAGNRSRIEFNGQRAEELTGSVERYQSDIASAESKRSQQATQILEADALIEKTKKLLQTKQDELTESTNRAAQARQARSRHESDDQSLQLALSRLEDRIAHLHDELTGLTGRRGATEARALELSAMIAEANHAREAAGRALARAQAEVQNEQAKLHEALADSEAAETELRRQQLSLADGERNVAAGERALAEKESRLEVLRQLNEEGEGLAVGSQAVLKGLHVPDRIRPVLGGALVASLKVDREFIPAIEAALGRNMHAVVLHDAGLAIEIFRELTEGKLGQAALALAGLAAEFPTNSRPELPDGAVDWAIDKVQAPGPLASLVRRLLDRVVIVSDLEAALRLKRSEPQLQFATLAGEFVSAEGIVFGGTANAQSDSVLQRSARIAALADEHLVAVTEHANFVEERDSAQITCDRAATLLDTARQRQQAAHISCAGAQGQLGLLQRELHDAERKVDNVESERATLAQQIEAADERIAHLQNELSGHREALIEHESRRAEAHRAVVTARAEEEETTQSLAQVRLAVATERQRHENLVSQRQPMTEREAELEELIAARREEIANYEIRLATQADESRAAEAAIAIQSAELLATEANVAAIAEQRTDRVATVSGFETELRRLRNSLTELHNQRAQQQVRQTQLQMQIENLAEHVSRRYQLDLRDFKSDPYAFTKTLRVQLKLREKSESPAEPTDSQEPTERDAGADNAQVERIIADLTRQLDNMGPVNLDAVQEYDELEQRHQFLETQNNDLTASCKELLDVIARINGTTQKLFADTFAQVRVNFREMFAELFGGGRADLVLLDENDPLNCGIDIIAKPPGKQLQSVSLLSGGERTMTAVALLFAIYMVRPSPFCILDEMDAPLDESNINRFIKLLDRFVGHSQFIIITHNKRTIAKADILYGVTMEERGVSKLVGMKLAAERGSDGELRKSERKELMQPQFPLEAAEQERELALSR